MINGKVAAGMPWWRESDTFADDPRWMVLAANRLDAVDRLQAAYCRMQARSSHVKHNGYLTHHTALQAAHGRARVLEALCTAVLDEPPMLHRKGDECTCLDELWVAGFDYRIHDFLRRNPSRSEYDRNEAQKADRKDARLRDLVKRRDALCCRYCRSGPLSSKAGRSRDRRKVLHLDHVDPDQPAGADGENYVVACASCSEFKGHRTPDEADMMLLPEPTDAQRAEWSTRERQLLDRPPYTQNQAADHRATNDETTPDQIADQITEQRARVDPNTDPTSDPNTDRGADPTNEPRPSVHPQHDEQQANQARAAPRNPPGTGGGGPAPPSDGPLARPTQPVRTARYPDPYTRRSRGNPTPSPIPDEQWPPGATRARPGTSQEQAP